MCGGAELLWAEPTLRFWSYRDGTRDVEYRLGSHFKFQNSHSDPNQKNDDSTEICLLGVASRRPAARGRHREAGYRRHVAHDCFFERVVCEIVAGIFRHALRFLSESPQGHRATFRGEVRRLFEECTVQHNNLDNAALKRLLEDAIVDGTKQSRCTIWLVDAGS